MTRRAGSTIIVALLLSRLAHGQVPETLSLREATARALEANRTLIASRTARAVGVAELQAAGQRPNPEVGVEAERETPHWAFAGTLPLEVHGQRQRRMDVAQAGIAVSEAETAKTTADVLSDVRRAYYQVVARIRRVDVAQELEVLAGRARDAAQERFQTGAAPRLEALQSQLVLAQAQNDSTTARGELTAARAELNALLAYPTDASFALADPLEAGTLPALDEALKIALDGNTDLQVLGKQIEEGRARVALAQAIRRPDPTVTGTFVYDSKPDFTYGWRLGARSRSRSSRRAVRTLPSRRPTSIASSPNARLARRRSPGRRGVRGLPRDFARQAVLRVSERHPAGVAAGRADGG